MVPKPFFHTSWKRSTKLCCVNCLVLHKTSKLEVTISTALNHHPSFYSKRSSSTSDCASDFENELVKIPQIVFSLRHTIRCNKSNGSGRPCRYDRILISFLLGLLPFVLPYPCIKRSQESFKLSRNWMYQPTPLPFQSSSSLYPPKNP